MDFIDEKTVKNEWVLLTINNNNNNNDFIVIPRQNKDEKIKELPLYMFGIKE